MKSEVSRNLLTVVCGVVRDDDNRLLIARRLKGDFARQWEFPGGKLERGESLEACLGRELKEELSIIVRIDSFYSKYDHSYPSLSLCLISYLCTYTCGDIKLVDHDRYEWVELNALRQYDFVEGDLPLVDILIKDQNLTN